MIELAKVSELCSEITRRMVNQGVYVLNLYGQDSVYLFDEEKYILQSK